LTRTRCFTPAVVARSRNHGSRNLVHAGAKGTSDLRSENIQLTKSHHSATMYKSNKINRTPDWLGECPHATTARRRGPCTTSTRICKQGPESTCVASGEYTCMTVDHDVVSARTRTFSHKNRPSGHWSASYALVTMSNPAYKAQDEQCCHVIYKITSCAYGSGRLLEEQPKAPDGV
jgi:hypothetical protein